ncbi:probable linoleate 9S-lipoxygenase 5 isoform X2 [Pyrus x bretschneideri]|uniref:probable linoleate 9S-lipoxygenase 5 isoform X2 n=1 Tax=Pyrus x bretschneideri TaxID=225117 RepID=UPI00202F8F24|nr:probable linoleate 9S-lipoxygenase 5 isoform X2 [Pyrus x bretschneideri]
MLHVLLKQLSPLSSVVVAAATTNNPDRSTSVIGRPGLLQTTDPMKVFPAGVLCMTDVARSQPLTVVSSAAKPSQTINVDYRQKTGEKKLRGTVVLMKKNVLELNDLKASVLDRFDELRGKRVLLQLISSVNCDPENGSQGKVGRPAYLEDWITKITSLTAEETAFDVTFDWDEEIGVPGAFIIRNEHHNEFYLKSLTLEDVPGEGRVHFVCNSWVYPAEKYRKDRVFFANKKFREEELKNLRGDDDDEKRELQEWDRVYGYAYYDDLGKPYMGKEYARPTLGGSSDFPYPRRVRIGRQTTENASPMMLPVNIFVYVPRDERFGHLKTSDAIAYALKSVSRLVKPDELATLVASQNEFGSLKDVIKLYEGGIRLPEVLQKSVRDNIPLETIKELFRPDGENFLKFPVPQVIKKDKSAWRTDEEFAREMLAGINPVTIRRLKEFPPASKLDRKAYGDQTSLITKENIAHNLKGLSIDQAIDENRLFILDHHDSIMPYLRRINTTSTKTYASRTLLFLQDDGTLKPLAIELSLPHPNGDQFGCTGKVYTPSSQGVESSIWQLAKAYVAVNDTGYHQLISHWLRTHAVMEPFIIATNRQLSVLHPIYKLLHPHFRDNMNVNALARQVLINASGILEKTVFPAKFSMEWSSAMYKNWVFPEQALPADLIKRGMAVEDSSSSHGVRLLIEDYPYAADGLEIWSAIKTWVKDYCSFYYKTDETVQKDSELQSWWKELHEEGHGDKKDEPWWPKMQTREELIELCTIIIWIASAYHAAINFGQYPYGGYPPNRPSTSRRFMPEEGTPEYEELKTNPEKAFLKTFTPELQTLLGMGTIEILSRHTVDEVYLGHRDAAEWTTDADILQASKNFRKKLDEIEECIKRKNEDKRLKNRSGPAKMPYTLLYPSSDPGLTGKGIPNSVSI